MGVKIRKLQWLEVSGILKTMHLGKELHHVFGRRGRMLACRAFIVPLTREEHQGPGYGKLTVKLRDDRREMAAAMAQANAQNMDVATCWWKGCIHANESCPLYRRALVKDAEEMAKCAAS